MLKIVFWFCFIWGSILLVFAVLFSGNSAEERTVDAVIFTITGSLLLASLILGRSCYAARERTRLIVTLVPSAELIMCMIGLVESLIHRP